MIRLIIFSSILLMYNIQKIIISFEYIGSVSIFKIFHLNVPLVIQRIPFMQMGNMEETQKRCLDDKWSLSENTTLEIWEKSYVNTSCFKKTLLLSLSHLRSTFCKISVEDICITLYRHLMLWNEVRSMQQ